MKLESAPHPQPDVPKPPAEAPDQRPPARSRIVKTDPYLQKLQAEQAEAVGKMLAFDALPPEGKIADLQRQLREA